MLEIFKSDIPALTGKEKKRIYVYVPDYEGTFSVLYMFDGNIEDILIERFKKVKEEADHVFAQTEEKDFHNLLYSILHVCYENRDYLSCFYNASPNLYLNHFIETVIQSNTPEPIDNITPDEYYAYAGRASILVGLTTEWLKRNCDISIKQMTETIERWTIN